MSKTKLILSGLAALLVSAAGSTAARNQAGMHIFTNQSYVEDVRRTPDLKVEDPMSVLSSVLAGLPDRVTVYPTENYYYFYFYHAGVKYAGNFRFDIADRDKGIVHFNYFKDFTEWQRDETDYGGMLGAKDGVTLKALSKLSYQLTYKDRTVRFDLNDLSGVKPPKEAVRANETYLGPVFDESGVRFILVFNTELKIFHYVLDETVPLADQFTKSETDPAISIGVRTGFALIDDRFSKRRILIGVSNGNSSVNNYLDGPFDQLPDNFLDGDTLKKAIIAASPEMDGQIDRLGNSADGETRYLIAPYMNYTDISELDMIGQCAAGEALPAYYNCFSFAGGGEDYTGEEEATEPDPQSPDDNADEGEDVPAEP